MWVRSYPHIARIIYKKRELLEVKYVNHVQDQKSSVIKLIFKHFLLFVATLRNRLILWLNAIILQISGSMVGFDFFVSNILFIDSSYRLHYRPERQRGEVARKASVRSIILLFKDYCISCIYKIQIDLTRTRHSSRSIM